MATTHCLTSTSLHHSSHKPKHNQTCSLISSLHFPYTNQTCFSLSYNKPTLHKNILTHVSALVENEPPPQQQYSNGYFNLHDDDTNENRNLFKPFELYVCNLPRSVGIVELLDKFQTYGTVQSVEVPRNAETGISKGCGYVTMSSPDEAKAAIAALDGSSPYKMYAGNLAWSVKPEDLRNHFSQFGTVISTTVLHDRKGGKNRVYGFLSFSSSTELEAAMSLDGTQFYGRTIKLREVVKWPEPEP